MITDRMVFLENMICVFDIDGVLAVHEYGYHRHNACKSYEWDDNIDLIKKVYRAARCLQQIIDFINARENKKNYVCSVAKSDTEREEKLNFVLQSYPNIPLSNIFFVQKPKQKLMILNNIFTRNYHTRDLYGSLGGYKSNIYLIDDSVELLTYIQDNSEYSTLHISSFLD